jgi:xylulokinase
VFDLPVQVPEQAEGAAFGGALQALWAFERANGHDTAIAAIARDHVQVDASTATRPNAEAVAAYATHYKAFLTFLDTAQTLYAPHPDTAR